ncbi:hypothetical protein DIX60_03785 [Streptococcus iniae]|uniref:hypothetical protein n=1 Tax=Streptococcus iniae TaxID=1346 RepID=UPI000372C5B0|nr:hypothetical protein [Streptococcus iniae]ESR08700.1 hypothetical protein IUSA1_11115 [Streptococcus iniae IUSA1]OHX27510.1 hypothetical protein BKX95_05060 [Streptococcus iniae]RLV28100.1 hypothetical protein DIX60_03785 [Streptococcus iniae]
MEMMKKHKGQIMLSIFIVITGISCSILPYLLLQNMVTEIANGSRGVMLFRKEIMIIWLGLIGNAVFHAL